MTPAPFSDRVDGWFTVEQPVTYWSFWRTLLKTAPVLLLAVAGAGLASRGAVLSASLAPVPFVFVAVTLGFAVREMDSTGMAISLGLGALYALLLVFTGVAGTLLSSPTLVLTAIAVLTFVAGIAGFAAPTLHGGAADELDRAYRQRREG